MSNRQATRALNTGSKAWRLIRQQVLIRDGYQCQACQKLVTGKDAHVDHRDGNDANQDDGNLWTLCQQGHARKTWAEENGKVWDGKCKQHRIGLDGWPV